MKILILKEDSLEESSVGFDTGFGLVVSSKLLKDEKMLQVVLTSEILSCHINKMLV